MRRAGRRPATGGSTIHQMQAAAVFRAACIWWIVLPPAALRAAPHPRCAAASSAVFAAPESTLLRFVLLGGLCSSPTSARVLRDGGTMNVWRYASGSLVIRLLCALSVLCAST